MSEKPSAWDRLKAILHGKGLWQFIKFGIVGLSNTIISLIVYWVCFYGLHFHYQLSNLIGFVISVTNAYYWNGKYVFSDQRKKNVWEHIKAYLKVFTSYGGTYLLGVALLFVWVEMAKIPAGIAPLINLVVTIPLNFILNKLWAFK